ncbi:MAG TPA: hypothetical protein VF590_16470 [Isosphaeraceae bacterium]
MFRMVRELCGAWVLAVVAVGSPARAGADDPVANPPPAAAPAGDERPTYIILDAPADIPELLRRLDHPDIIVLKGDPGAWPVRPGGEAAAATGVTRVEVTGEVRGELAELTVELEVATADAAAAWVPIRLDGRNLPWAREGDRELPLRVAETGSWEVEVRGRGEHRVRIAVLAPVVATAERSGLDLAIPEAPTTWIRLDVPQRVAEAEAGARDPVAVETREGGRGSRLSAHLPPRSRLGLTWRAGAEPARPPAPAIAAQGEIALDIAPDAVRASSSWSITAKRGTVASLAVRLDPAEELLSVKLDGQPLSLEGPADRAAGVRTIPLAEPLRPGPPRRLDLATRRPLGPGASTRLTYCGVPFVGGVEQAGVVAIAQSGDLWIFDTPGRGLRPIDPRELPVELRARPATVLAYRFADQPFELGLRVEPSPPRLRVATRSTLVVEADAARLDAWLDYQVTRGRIFEVRVVLPEGLDLETAGPDEVVASALCPHPGPAGGRDPRVLLLRLTAKAQDEKAFRIHLTGRHPLTGAATAAIPLFQPQDGTFGDGKVAVVASGNIGVELAAEAADAVRFTPAGAGPPADWPWPAPRPEADPAAALWLRRETIAATLPLRIVARPRAVLHQTTLTARIDRRELDVRQETACSVQNGTLSALEVVVPAALAGHWDLEGTEVAGREPLGIGPDGSVRYRLGLARTATEAVTLRFRYRLPLAGALAPDRPLRVDLPALRVQEGSMLPSRLLVAADPGIGLAPEGPGWVRASGRETAERLEGDSPLRFTRVEPAGAAGVARVVATALPLVPLPPLVAPRLWLRTIQGPEGDLQGLAWYWVEAHEEALAVALPDGATLLRAQVDGEAAAVERQARPAGYRLRFPPGAATPRLVRLEYTVPAQAAAGGWDPPRLLDGGLVQQTLWEAWVTGGRAVLGVPPGWTDENRWYWDLYVWKRRPWKDAAGLATWLAGPRARPWLASVAADEGRFGFHGYLFSRAGGPTPLRPWVVARAGLVGACSGSVLGLGLVLLVWRPRGLWIVLAAVSLALVVAAAVQPGLVLPALQSALVGVVLVLVAALMRRLLERRRPAPLRLGESSGLALGPPSGSAPAVVVGSDDSTAIRPRATASEHPRPILPVGLGGDVIEIPAPGPDS